MTSFCPSHAWDDYYASQEGDDTICALCGTDLPDTDPGIPGIVNRQDSPWWQGGYCSASCLLASGDSASLPGIVRGYARRECHTVKGFVDALGFSDTLRLTLRAIDRHNPASIRVRLVDGTVCGPSDDVSGVPDSARIIGVLIGGIAWDCSDWEYGTELPLPPGVDAAGIRALVDDLFADFDDALADYRATCEYEDVGYAD